MTDAALTPDIERSRLRAIVQRDMELANSLHADDFEFITPRGRVFSKEQYTALYESRDGRWQVVWSHTTRIKH